MSNIPAFSTLLSIAILTSCADQSQKAPVQEASHEDLSSATFIDLSHEYSRETVYWVTAKEFELDTVFAGETDKGFYYTANNFTTAEHGGTHIDAPVHFARGAQTVDQIPLNKLIGSAIKIDVSSRALDNPDYLISVDDLEGWEKEHNTKIPDGSIVLLQSGYSQYYPDKLKYLGTDQRGEQALPLMHFPGLAPEAAEWLVANRKIHAIGIDTPSIDYGQSQDFRSHVILLEKNIPAFENLTNLDQLPDSGFEIIALPMKIKGGSGGPLRIVAVLR